MLDGMQGILVWVGLIVVTAAAVAMCIFVTVGVALGVALVVGAPF